MLIAIHSSKKASEARGYRVMHIQRHLSFIFSHDTWQSLLQRKKSVRGISLWWMKTKHTQKHRSFITRRCCRLDFLFPFTYQQEKPPRARNSSHFYRNIGADVQQRPIVHLVWRPTIFEMPCTKDVMNPHGDLSRPKKVLPDLCWSLFVPCNVRLDSPSHLAKATISAEDILSYVSAESAP